MPRNISGKGGNSVANNRYDVLHASQYRCAVGGEWKPRSSFSQKNHNNLENKVKIGMKVNPANTGMKCRDHSGEPKLERRCEGPCNKVKPLSAFSKNNLANGMTWCQSCTNWQLSQDDFQDAEIEYDNGPFQAPSRKPISLSTVNGDDGRQSVVVAVSSHDAQSSAPSFSFLRPCDTDSVSGRLFRPASRASGTVPPHLQSVIQGSDGGAALDGPDMDESYQPDDASLLPDDSASQYRKPGVSNLDNRGPTRLTAAALHQTEQGPKCFNSWENAGRQHMQRRPGNSDIGTDRSFSTQKISTIQGSERGRTQTTKPRICEPETPGRSRKFAKIPRMTQPPPPIPEWNENDVHIDDDGSEPDLP
ncbi:hypothetical protein VUR80DRAFT_4880 [Thermomyces stellatus]